MGEPCLSIKNVRFLSRLLWFGWLFEVLFFLGSMKHVPMGLSTSDMPHLVDKKGQPLLLPQNSLSLFGWLDEKESRMGPWYPDCFLPWYPNQKRIQLKINTWFMWKPISKPTPLPPPTFNIKIKVRKRYLTRAKRWKPIPPPNFTSWETLFMDWSSPTTYQGENTKDI